jgi:hypothetical protein
LQDEYKYLYDLLLHWYMINPEYRNAPDPNAASASQNAATTSSSSANHTPTIQTALKQYQTGNNKPTQPVRYAPQQDLQSAMQRMQTALGTIHQQNHAADLRIMANHV